MLNPENKGHTYSWVEGTKTESTLSVGDIRGRIRALMFEMGLASFNFRTNANKAVVIDVADSSTLNALDKKELLATLQWLDNGVMLKADAANIQPSAFEQKKKLVADLQVALAKLRPPEYSISARLVIRDQPINVALGMVKADDPESFYGLSVTNLKGLKRKLSGF